MREWELISDRVNFVSVKYKLGKTSISSASKFLVSSWLFAIPPCGEIELAIGLK